MGNNANSVELLEVSIERSVTPFRLSKYDVVVDSLTRLRLEPPGYASVNYRAFNTDTQELQFELQRAVLSYRIEMLAPDRRVIMSIKEKSFEGYFRIYEAVVSCEFTDRILNDRVRVFTEGNCGDHVALYYMERHAVELPPMVKRGNMKRTTCKMIGRSRRPEMGDDEFLVATKGVDLTMLLLLWVVRRDIQERNGPLGSVHPITKCSGGD